MSKGRWAKVGCGLALSLAAGLSGLGSTSSTVAQWAQPALAVFGLILIIDGVAFKDKPRDNAK